MDRALKERIVGAVVLVVLAVLIVPVFLDGDSEYSENYQESIVLPGQEQQPASQKTVVLDRDRAEPVPGARISPPAAPSRLAQASATDAQTRQALPVRFATTRPSS